MDRRGEGQKDDSNGDDSPSKNRLDKLWQCLKCTVWSAGIRGRAPKAPRGWPGRVWGGGLNF